MQFGTPFKKGCGVDSVDMNISFPTTTTPGTVKVDRAERALASTTVTYAATGLYTVTLPVGSTFPTGPSGFAGPLTVQITPQFSALGNKFQVYPVGEATQANGQITIVLQTTDFTGAAAAPAAAAGSRINIQIMGANNGGK